MSISIRIDSLVCVGCGTAVEAGLLGGSALKNLEKAGGQCRCRGSRFHATLTKVVEGREASTVGDIATRVALGRAGRMAANNSFTMEKSYEIDVESSDLIQNLARPPEKIVEWITGLLKAVAKANLRPDQKICAECGEIFVVGRAPHLQEGFCSPMCMKKQRPGAVAAKPAGPVQMPCPKCGRVVKVRGESGRCMYCGTGVSVS